MARSVRVEIIADPSRFIAGSRMAQREAGSFNENVTKLGRGALAGSLSLTGFGRAIAFASAQFLGGFGLTFALSRAAEAAIKFDSEMTRIHTQAGVAAGQIKGLSEQLLIMATKVNTGPEELAKGLYHIESSGFHGAVALRMLTYAAREAKVGHADLEEVASSLAAAFRTEGHAAESTSQQLRSVKQVAGELNAIIGTGNLRTGELAKALMSGVVPAGRAFGISLQDVGSALDVLTHAGVPAQVAATRLRTTLSFLGGQAKPTTKALKEIGLSSRDLANVIRQNGLIAGLQLLAEHLQKVGGINSTAGIHVITEAFGAARSSATVITLLQNLDQLQQNFDQIGRLAKNFGTSWQGYLQTAQASTDRLRASVQVMAITIGHALEPTITSVANSLAKWLQSSDHQREVQEYVAKSVNAVVFAIRSMIKEIEFIAAPVGGVIHLFEVLIALKLGTVFVGWANTMKMLIVKFNELKNAQKNVGDAAVEMAAKEKLAAESVAGTVAATTAATEAQAAGAAVTPMQQARVAGAVEREAATAPREFGINFFGQAPMAYQPKPPLPFSQYSRSPLDARAEGLGSGAAVYTPLVTGEKLAAAEKEAAAAARAAETVGGFRAALGLATTAVGRFGFYGIVAATTIQLGYMIGKITGLNAQIGKGIHWFENLVHHQFPPQTPKQEQNAQNLARLAITKSPSGQLPNAQNLDELAKARQLVEAFHQSVIKPLIFDLGSAVSQSDRFNHMGLQPLTTGAGLGPLTPQAKDTSPRERLIRALMVELKINRKDAEKDLNEVLKNLQHELDMQKLAIKAIIQTGGGDTFAQNLRTDHPFVQPQVHVGAIPALDTLSRLDQELAAAQLRVAEGDKSANEEVVRILRERVAFDEKYAKIQEGLIKTDARHAKEHSATVTKLLNDEAQAYAQIQQAMAQTFSISTGLQIAQIQAQLTTSKADDVRAAEAVARAAKAAIDSGKLSGDALVQAWQQYADAVQQVEAAKKKNFDIPVALQIGQATAALTYSTADDVSNAEKIRAWARKMLKVAKGTDRVSLLNTIKNATDTINNSLQLPLKLQFAQAQAALTVTNVDDAKVERQIFNYWKQVAARQKKLGHTLAFLQALQNEGEAFSQLQQTGPATSYEMTSTHMLTAGLGLSRSQRIAEEQRLAQSEAHGGRRPKPGEVGALGTPVNVTVVIDGDYIKKQKVTKTLQSERSRTTPQRRGRHGGHGLGID